MTGFLAAQLDGVGGQELVTTAEVVDARNRGVEGAGKLVTVYTWHDGAFRKLASISIPLNSEPLAAGDLDGDGREELYGVDTRNHLLTLTWAGGKLKVTGSALLGTWMIGSMAVGDVRRPGVPELLLAVDPSQRFDSQGEPGCTLLLGYRRRGNRWTRGWGEAIKQRGMTLDLRCGDYHPLPGKELVLEHGPSDLSASLFELWRWNGRRLAKLAETVTSSAWATGLQSWLGVSDRLIGGVRAIVAEADYDTSEATGHDTSAGELLQWDGKELRALYRLPGIPVAIGDWRGSGQIGILTRRPGGVYTLYEPHPVVSHRQTTARTQTK